MGVTYLGSQGVPAEAKGGGVAEDDAEVRGRNGCIPPLWALHSVRDPLAVWSNFDVPIQESSAANVIPREKLVNGLNAAKGLWSMTMQRSVTPPSEKIALWCGSSLRVSLSISMCPQSEKEPQ